MKKIGDEEFPRCQRFMCGLGLPPLMWGKNALKPQCRCRKNIGDLIGKRAM